MRHIFFVFAFILFIPSAALAQGKIKYKEYSFTEFFELIEAEEDTIFRLSNAFIQFKPAQDSSRYGYTRGRNNSIESGRFLPKPVRTDTITIDKAIELNNVQFIDAVGDERMGFMGFGGLSYIKFTKPVDLTNSLTGTFTDISFEDRVRILFSEDFLLDSFTAEDLNTILLNRGSYFLRSNFKQGLRIRQFEGNDGANISIDIESCTFNPTNLTSQDLAIFIRKVEGFLFTNNTVARSAFSNIGVNDAAYFRLDKNHFTGLVELYMPENSKSMSMSQNRFDKSVLLVSGALEPTYSITWPQFENKLINGNFFTQKMGELQIDPLVAYKPRLMGFNDENATYYLDSLKIQDEFVHKEESKIRGQLYDFYKSQHDIPYANRVYLELKDLETARLAYLYRQNPSFDTFFKWKVNQFLKTFSAYGTEPSKAITFSVYVILLFALIYLFFPNHWDSHGKNRIMNRYRFFTKYMKKDTGMHDVYLDERQPELLASEDFKGYMLDSEKEIPKFFMTTAMPLYRWSVAGTRSASWLLSKVDVLKGKWSDTEETKRGGKSFLLITAFLIALTYDIFIKMLNALMLSINTFTTLGFGEIPIKGLPRYLAIVQGFIGWFMLTIFSVSLISQLLN